MRISSLPARSLTWYWRTNLAVVLGVATATGVLGGALLVGDSVRGSLRDLALGRLGNADSIISGDVFFREALADEVGSACPLISVRGIAAHEPSRRRAAGVQVYGVDERFWRFQGLPGEPPRNREVLLSEALARELGGKAGDAILLRIEKPSVIPLESLHGRKEDVGKTLRLTMSGIAPREFSLEASQGEVRAVFVPLAGLQRELEQPDRVNTALVSTGTDIQAALARHYRLEDAGIRLTRLPERDSWALESESGFINDALATAASTVARNAGAQAEPVLTYLANTIRIGGRETPYSLVTALNTDPAPAEEDGITLNQWLAADLGAKSGDAVTLEYFVWKADGNLGTERAEFRVTGIVPIAGLAADRDLAPQYPGITDSDTLSDWNPPFPLDLSRVRPRDEQYWKEYRTTPKAFIRYSRGKELWGSRFGNVTSIRISPAAEQFGTALRNAIEPSKLGLKVVPARAQALEAARGATNFGEYFLYFSFFLMASALLLAGLFFKLGVEQRMREIGTLRALGYTAGKIRLLFLLEGTALALAGALAGVAVAWGYGALIMYGLRTWWVGAVGTSLLSLHVTGPSLAWGAAAGIVAGLAAIAWTLRRLAGATPRALVAGGEPERESRWRGIAGGVAGILGLTLAGSALAGWLDQTAGFFGGGVLLLIAGLLIQSEWLRSRRLAAIGSRMTLGMRSATYRPGRSVLCIALIASATFLIVSLDTFRREGNSRGAGGFPLIAESMLPLIHDPNTPAGRDALNLPPVDGVRFVSFRLRPGDDASCLNLYQPKNPRVLAPPPEFLRTARFDFQGSITPIENPWLLLEAEQPDGAIPAIVDANSMTYVLHRKLGEEFAVGSTRFRIVAALRDSVFQGELLISQASFLRLYPETPGYRVFLLDAPPQRMREIEGVLEEALSDYGFDIQSAGDRLASYHRVENTYLATFRALGGLGLILGVVGLGAVVLRNVLERRRELALLRAVGYRPRHLAAVVLAENALILFLGLITGAGSALVAVGPAVAARGGQLPIISLTVLLGSVLLAGLAASIAATAAALRSPLLAALRSE